MIKDIHSIYQLYSDHLLNEQKRDYIVAFASQSLAFLLRKFETKYESYDQLFTLLFDSIIKRSSLVNGIGYLLFEVVKGLKNQLNSSTNVLLSDLLDKQNDPKYIDSSAVRQCVGYFFNAIANYVDKNSVGIVWEILINKTNQQLSTDHSLSNNIAILEILVCHKNCILVREESNTIIKLVINIYKEASDRLNDESCESLNNIITQLLENRISTMTVTNIQLVIQTVINSTISHEQKLNFFDKLASFKFFDRDVLPTINEFMNDNFNLIATPHSSTLNGLLRFILNRQSISTNGCKLKLNQQAATSLFNGLQDAIKRNDLNSIWRYVIILPNIETVSKDHLSKVLIDLLVKSLSDLSEQSKERKSMLIYQLQKSLINTNDAFTQINPDLYIEHLNKFPTQLPVLIAFKVYLDNMKKLNLELSDECKTKFEELFFTKLQTNLSHQHSLMRMTILELLIHFTEDPSNQTNESKSESVFSVCLKIEKVNFSEPGECQRLITKLEYTNSTTYLPLTRNETYSYRLTPIHHLLGVYYINYTPLWETIKSVLINYATNHKNINEFWKILSDHIKRTDLIIYESLFDWINVNEYKAHDELIDAQILKLYANEDRPDFFNHRIQLLNLLISAPQLTEKFNRFIVQWFSSF